VQVLRTSSISDQEEEEEEEEEEMSYVGKASAFPGIRLHVEPTAKSSSEKTERTSTPPTSRLVQEYVASTQPSSPSQLPSPSSSEQASKAQQPPLQYQKVSFCCSWETCCVHLRVKTDYRRDWSDLQSATRVDKSEEPSRDKYPIPCVYSYSPSTYSPLLFWSQTAVAGRKGCEIAEMLSNYGSLLNSTFLPVETIFGWLRFALYFFNLS